MNFIIILILALFSSLPAGAEEGVLTLDEAVAEVLATNQDIQAAQYRTTAAKARIPQAKSLEDPMVGVEFYDVPIDTLDVTQGMEINYMIEQEIPFPGKRRIRGKAARHEADAVRENSRGRIADVLLDLKRTYYDLYRLDRTLEALKENERLMRQFLGTAETWYATGKAGADTPLKAQVELSEIQNEQILLQQERITHEAHLKALLNRPSHGEIRLPKNLQWPRVSKNLDEIEALALEKRPEIREITSMRKSQKAELTAARQGLIPDFSLGLEYNQRPNQIDAWTGTAKINLPLFFWGKNRGEIREAKANLKASEAEENSIRVHTQHEIEQAFSGVRAGEKLVQSYRSGILPQSKATLEAARLAYGAGKVDFMTLIDSARTYKDLQISFYENQAMLGMTFAELERLVGVDLEKK